MPKTFFENKTFKTSENCLQIITWVAKSLPLVVVFLTATHIEHAIYHRRATDHFATMPRARIAIHCQARPAVWLRPGKKVKVDFKSKIKQENAILGFE